MSKVFDRYAAVVFLTIGLLFMVESKRITQSAYGSNVGPDVFPFYLGLILILLSLRLFYETFRYTTTKKNKESLDYKKFGAILGMAILYAYFLEDIGYVISTFIFLLIGFQMMKRGKLTSSLIISAAFSFGIYYLFVEVLNGSLPGFPSWLGLS